MLLARRLLLYFLVGFSAHAQKFYTYLLDLGPNYVELAWGTTDGPNTIGRSSTSHGPAIIKIDNRTIESRLNYVVIGDLQPDHTYSYDITIGPTKVGSGEFRTWADKAEKLSFFVIGDFGTGQQPQYKIAQAMWQEFQRLEKTDSPVRFMLSVGDNIYGNVTTMFFGVSHTGANDSDWEPKFFQPYEPLLGRIPFFGTLGNHDGNETESHRDLPAFLDNFPFPNDKPGRYYSFEYGGLAKFFGLDSTANTLNGRPAPQYLETSAEFQWMKREFAKPKPMWAIPFYHHPVFNAGPLHVPSLHNLQHWVDLFGASGVKVVFNGHEHNFQMSDASDISRGIRFITSGAGGELRPGDVRSKMRESNIAAWAPQNHFLSVQIEGKTMKITPIGFEPLTIVDPDGHGVPLPVVITLP